MNRTGLLIALVIAVATGLVFSLAPQLDIAISRLVFDSKIGAFYLAVLVFYQGHGWVEQVRDAAMWVVGLLALAPAAAVIIKLVRPNRPPECHLIQAVWTPNQGSSFRLMLSGRARRCGSVREAIRSLR